MAVSSGLVGQEMIVTLEFPDGRAYSGKCIAASVTKEVEMVDLYSGPLAISGLAHWSMELEGLDDLDITDRSVYATATEWMCGYCGTPNERAARKCTECAAPRPFVYS
jgi:hypothetical protein